MAPLVEGQERRMKHPKRYMRDGVATTRRVRDVTEVQCTIHPWGKCFLAVTSWAGDPTPRADERWHAYECRSGAIGLLGPLVGRETPQFQQGIRRRVLNRLGR